MNEADTCRTYVLPWLKPAGWEHEYISRQMVLRPGRIVPIGDRHTRKEGLCPDYTLFLQQHHPITSRRDEGQHTAGLQVKSGQELRPFVGWTFSSSPSVASGIPSVLRPSGGAFKGEL